VGNNTLSGNSSHNLKKHMQTTSEYLLLFRGTNWHKGLSPAEIEKVVNQWKEWFNGLETEGKIKSGLPLMSEGKVVSGPGGRFVVDGPFAESKEAIGGYFLLSACTLDEAISVARRCPGLAHGAAVEVRPVADMCAQLRIARPVKAELHAAGSV
jgi:hypothetical protein